MKKIKYKSYWFVFYMSNKGSFGRLTYKSTGKYLNLKSVEMDLEKKYPSFKFCVSNYKEISKGEYEFLNQPTHEEDTDK